MEQVPTRAGTDAKMPAARTEEKSGRDALLTAAISVKKAAAGVTEKIKKQTHQTIEISEAAAITTSKFAKSERLFYKTLHELKYDNRNKLILVLVFIVLVLLWYLRL